MSRVRGRRPRLTAANTVEPADDQDLIETLGELRRAGSVLELDGGRLPLELEPLAALLVDVILGRITGHAPGRCSECGAVAIVAVRTASGAIRPPPRCRLTPVCPGRVVIAVEDRRGVSSILTRRSGS